MTGARLGRVLRSAVAALLLGVASLEAAGEYRTVEVESLRITVDSEWPGFVAPGYIPVRVELTNLGQARTISVTVQGSRFFGAGRGIRSGSMEVLRVVSLARGDRVRFTMPMPVIADNENGHVVIRENGQVIQRFGYTSFQVPPRPSAAGALIVADPSAGFAPIAAAWRRLARGGSSAGRSGPSLDLVLDPERLPTNWIGYTSLRAIVFGAEEWRRLGEEHRSAVLSWTAAGGDLVLIDTDVHAMFASAATANPQPLPAVRGYLYGRVHGVPMGEVSTRGLPAILSAIEKLQDPHFALPFNTTNDWNSIAERGFRLPIPGVEGVRARAYLFILIVFSLLIGPVNYWLLWRKRQQVLFVLTAPALSILFVFVLAGYVLASEGTGIHARAMTITMLDQARRQAATRASISLYSGGLTTPAGLRFAPDTAVVPIGPDGSGSVERLALNLTDGQRFDNGAILSRAPSNLEEVTVRTARERLTFTREAGGIAVVNGLDAAVSTLLYREKGLVYHLASPLAPGARAMLTAGGIDPKMVVPDNVPIAFRLRHLVENQPDGSYLAVLDRSPFWEHGVQSILERGSFHLVIGWVAGQP